VYCSLSARCVSMHSQRRAALCVANSNISHRHRDYPSLAVVRKNSILAAGVASFLNDWHDHVVLSAFSIIVRLAWNLLQWCGLVLRPRESLEAEILFLRRQLALYRERGVKPKRVDAAARATLTLLSRWFDWRSALVVVRTETLIRWHRAGFRLLWRWKSRPGRPPIPVELRELIRQMARENPAWGQVRIANELLLKLGLRVSPRTVGR
jgi:putative transposase